MNIKNRKSIVVIAFLVSIFLMSLSTIAATDIIATIPTLEPVTQGHSVEIPQGGSNGTAMWSYCNISTIVNPDHITIVKDVLMTADGTRFVYILPGSNTSILGTYIVTGFCGDGYNIRPFAYKIPVTTTGRDNSISLWIVLISLAFSIVLLIMAFGFDSIYIAFLSGCLWIVSGILIYLYGFGNLSDMYTRAISMVTLAIGLIVFFAAAFHHDDGEGLAKAFGLDKEEEEDDHDYFKGK